MATLDYAEADHRETLGSNADSSIEAKNEEEAILALVQEERKKKVESNPRSKKEMKGRRVIKTKNPWCHSEFLQVG